MLPSVRTSPVPNDPPLRLTGVASFTADFETLTGLIAAAPLRPGPKQLLRAFVDQVDIRNLQAEFAVTTTALVAATGWTPPTIRKHRYELERLGILRCRRVAAGGEANVYLLDTESLRRQVSVTTSQVSRGPAIGSSASRPLAAATAPPVQKSAVPDRQPLPRTGYGLAATGNELARDRQVAFPSTYIHERENSISSSMHECTTGKDLAWAMDPALDNLALLRLAGVKGPNLTRIASDPSVSLDRIRETIRLVWTDRAVRCRPAFLVYLLKERTGGLPPRSPAPSADAQAFLAMVERERRGRGFSRGTAEPIGRLLSREPPER